MRIMRRVDPEGVQCRKRNRLKRRLYRSKVYSMILAVICRTLCVVLPKFKFCLGITYC